MEHLRAYDGDAYRKAAQKIRDSQDEMANLDPGLRMGMGGTVRIILHQLSCAAMDITLRPGSPEQKRQAMLVLAKAVSGAVSALAEVETPNTSTEVKAPGSATDLRTDRQGLKELLEEFGVDSTQS